MNILYVTGLFAQNEKDEKLGGMAKAVYMNAKGMKDRGHNVCVLTVSNRKREWEYKGIKVVSVNAEHGIDKSSDLEMIYQIIRREILIEKEIRKISSKKKIDIIQYTGWFGIGLLHFNRIPTVMRISSYTKAQLECNYSNRRVNILSYIERLAMKRMNAVYAPSRIMAKKIEADIKRKVYVIETPYIQEGVQADETAWRKKVGEKKYILFFGRISIDKGIYIIKDALYKILSDYEDIYFVFAGAFDTNGVKKVELMQAAKEHQKRLIFCGNLSKKQLWPLIEHAYMVLMPSLMDNFPNACAEAMSLGKIVIGTNGSSLEQFITDSYNGYLSQIGDSESLIEKIREVLKLEQEKKKEISENAKKRIDKLNINDYCEKMEKMYDTICRKSYFKRGMKK